MQSVKQDGIKYHFFSLWYDSTWDWTPVSRTIGKHSTDKANGLKKLINIFIYKNKLIFICYYKVIFNCYVLLIHRIFK